MKCICSPNGGANIVLVQMAVRHYRFSGWIYRRLHTEFYSGGLGGGTKYRLWLSRYRQKEKQPIKLIGWALDGLRTFAYLRDACDTN